MATPSPLFDSFYSMVKLATVRLFVEKDIFQAIPPEGISLAQLSENVKVDLNLLSRLSNFLLAAGILAPTSSSTTPQTQNIRLSPDYELFRNPRVAPMYSYLFDTFLASTVKWPEYFTKNGFREPELATACPFGLAAGYPDKTFYQVLESQPDRAAAFNSAMAMAVPEIPITGIYEFAWIAEHAGSPGSESRTLIVDVGGGMGQALRAILEAYPAIPAARCVLEDQAPMIRQATERMAQGDILKEVQMLSHSFFTEQPVKGALVYYIRRVLNDWSDSECVIILQHIRDACAGDSHVLISESLLAGEPTMLAAGVDLFMMNVGGKRRTEGMFAALAEQAGFKIQAVYRDSGDFDNAVIQLEPV
ncbi:S-adenosyl-L-methionine-dependent methyltransferase [Aspergillus karnatakaensis]|uniref:S-adenosyl-L-methionine-dependent methyltransferase n=1 Tax=Aspergillus karnatakaensis TaxID=1810916 RepID=UPI003CCD2543